MDKLLGIFEQALTEDTFISCVFSNPRLKSEEYKKVSCKPVMISQTVMIQFASLKDNKEFHNNVALTDAIGYIKTHCLGYKQVQLFTSTHDYQALVNKKGGATIKKTAATKTKPVAITHNRTKTYILDHEGSHGFLKRLGIMDLEGKIKPTKYDKYKQINKYLETIASVIPELGEDQVRVIDFGCGKSYLTFAMYHYLKERLGKNVEIVGLDLKEDVIQFCNTLATELGFSDLKFQIGDIGHYTTNKRIDMVVSLHACNTATDAALAKAINWDAKVILAVPCCQHECATQIVNPTFEPLLKHGILKEKIASLITDGLRAQKLEAEGYKVSVSEFIDMQHTPKNILIKAVRSSKSVDPKAQADYDILSNYFGLDLSLPHMITKERGEA
ncbi:MAG: class I SAM-dependent methyltransferase [Cellulosilyticaceae bacterium]